MGQTGAAQRAGRAPPLFVTVDPDRDTTDVLAEYITVFNPRFVALRGSEAETAEAFYR